MGEQALKNPQNPAIDDLQNLNDDDLMFAVVVCNIVVVVAGLSLKMLMRLDKKDCDLNLNFGVDP